MDDRDQAIDELMALWDELYPDPVDVLEDQLARELGLQRPPRLTQREWRSARVRAINAADQGRS